MHVFTKAGLIVVLSTAMGGAPALAQVGANAASGASAGAAAVAGGSSSGVNFAPSTHVAGSPPSQALGSYGGGANECAEGFGFNLGMQMVGVGFNRATSNEDCLRMKVASHFYNAGNAFKDSRYVTAATLLDCQKDERTMMACKASGLWVGHASGYYAQPAATYAAPQAAYAAPAYAAAYAPAPQPAAQPVYGYAPAAYPVRQERLVPALIPAYVPQSSVHLASWCNAIDPAERVRYPGDCS